MKGLYLQFKTNKAALARELEKSVSPAEHIPTPSTAIIDGMSLVQKMNGNNKTFRWQTHSWEHFAISTCQCANAP